MRKIIKAAFAVILILSLASCAPAKKMAVMPNSSTETALTGCSKAEARRRLGPPNQSYFSTFYKLPFHYFMMWTYPDKDLYVYITDGKVCKTQRISDTSNSAYYLSIIKKKK